MGVVKCLNHHLVERYNVLYEKEGEVCRYTTGLIHLYISELSLTVYQSLSFQRM